MSANELLERLMDKVDEWICEASDIATELKEAGHCDIADYIKRGIVAELEMSLNNNHGWLGKKSPTIQEMLDNVGGEQ